MPAKPVASFIPVGGCNMNPLFNAEVPGYVDIEPRYKKPAAELLDPDFHVAVAALKSIPSFDSWMADCYDAIMAYYDAKTVNDKRAAAVRIAKSVWEAAENELSIGRFLNSIADNWLEGIKDEREAFDWQKMEWTEAIELAYIAKTMRHFVQVDMVVTLDERVQHLAALFCNANILWRRCSDLYTGEKLDVKINN
jgi:hypothetical protein